MEQRKLNDQANTLVDLAKVSAAGEGGSAQAAHMAPGRPLQPDRKSVV